MSADDIDKVRSLPWDSDGLWWSWVCACGAQNVTVPPELDQDDEDAQTEPAIGRAWHDELTCTWCGETGAEADGLGHCTPEDLLRRPGS